MAMFPLGSVLLPGGVAPLRLFEERYLEMHERVMLAGDPFAIVLIERGFEVGGGDQRFDVGTAARVAASSEMDDGSRLVIAVGSARVRVTEWLEDDPYPRAHVDELPEPLPTDPEVVDACAAELRTTFGLLTELGVDVGEAPELPDNQVLAVYQAAQLAPLQMLDKQHVLETDDPDARAALVLRLLTDRNELLRLQLEGA